MINIMVSMDSIGSKLTDSILQIGLAAFDETYDVIDYITINIDQIQSILDGFTVDTDTAVKYWNQQPSDVIDGLMRGERVSPADGADILDVWLTNVTSGQEFVLWFHNIKFTLDKIDVFLSTYKKRTLTNRTNIHLIQECNTLYAFIKQVNPTGYNDLFSNYKFSSHDNGKLCVDRVDFMSKAVGLVKSKRIKSRDTQPDTIENGEFDAFV